MRRIPEPAPSIDDAGVMHVDDDAWSDANLAAEVEWEAQSGVLDDLAALQVSSCLRMAEHEPTGPCLQPVLTRSPLLMSAYAQSSFRSRKSGPAFFGCLHSDAHETGYPSACMVAVAGFPCLSGLGS